MANNNQRMIEYNPVGVITDIPASELEDDSYSFVSNFVFKNGAAIAAAGYSPMVPTLLFNPFVVGTVRTPLTYFWIYAGDDGVGLTDGTNAFDLTPVGGVNGGVGEWTIANINNLPMLCGGHTDPPWYWDQVTANPVQPLPNFPANTTAGFVRSFKNFAIVGDILSAGNNFENQIIWSDPVEPGVVPSIWTAAPDNLAGDNVLASTEGAIIDGVALRDQFLLFKSHSTYSMRFTGGVGVFAFSKLFTSIGILGRNCAMEYKALVYMFTDGDIVVTDGHTVQSIADQLVRITVFSELDPDNFAAAFVQVWREDDQMMFCYPTVGSTYCNKAAMYNTITKEWGFRDLPNVAHGQNGLEVGDTVVFTWATLPYVTWDLWLDSAWTSSNVRSTNDSLVLGEVVGAVGELQSLGRIASVLPPVFNNVLQKTTMDLGDENRVKTINELWLNLNNYKAGITINVRLGIQQNKYDAVAWQPYQTFDPLTQEKLDIFVSGRYISIELRTTETNDRKFRIFGFRFRFRFAGRY